MKKIYNKLTMLYFTILILYIQVVNILYCYNIINSDVVSTGLVIIGSLGIIIYILYKVFDKTIKTHDIFIIMMILFGIMSWQFAFVKRVALLGFKNGREGLLVLITYYVIFLVATTIKEKKYKDYIVNLITFIGIINVFYSYLQIPRLPYLLNIPIADIWGYPSGFLSNSNFYGSFMVMLTGIWLTRFLFSDKKNIDYKSLIFFIIFLSGLLLSGAMSAIVGLICMLIFSLIIFFLKRKNIILKNIVPKYVILLISFLSLYFIVSFVTDVNLSSDIKEMGTQAISTVTSGIDESFGTGRIHIWKEALYYFNKYDYWDTGVGIDNFYYIGHGNIIVDVVSGDQVYKAHNEYLQILVTEGIFMLVTYLSFLFFIFIKGLIYIKKNKSCDITFLSIFVAFVGYSIQAFFNISMTRVAPFYFLLCGFVSCYGDEVFKIASSNSN